MVPESRKEPSGGEERGVDKETTSGSVPPALRLRIMTLLETGLSTEEIFARLAGSETMAADPQQAADIKSQVEETIRRSNRKPLPPARPTYRRWASIQCP